MYYVLLQVFIISRVIIMIIGILGHILSFIVFSQPVFRKNSISAYCRTLAVFECFTVNQLISDISLAFFKTYLPISSHTYCKIFYFISSAFSSIPGWILVFFSFDKMISMRQQVSDKLDFIKKRSFQFATIGFIVLANLVIYSEIAILLNVVVFNLTTFEDGSESTFRIVYSCDLENMQFSGFVNWFYLFESSVIPFGLMTFTSVVIVRWLIRSRKSLEKSSRDVQQIKERRTRDVKFAITSLALNVLFVVLKLPMTLYYLLDLYGRWKSAEFYNFCIELFFLNSSITFFVHLISNSLFRKQLKMFLSFHISNSVGVTTLNNT